MTKSQTKKVVDALVSAKVLPVVRVKRAIAAKTKKVLVDTKMLAANDQFREGSDNPEAIQATMDEVAAEPKATGLAEKPKMTVSKKGIAARAEGLRLFQVASRPSQADCRKVFGKDAGKLTWAQRAEKLGLASAEEAATSFQALLAKAK